MDLLKIATDGYIGTTDGFTLSLGTAGYLHVKVEIESDGTRTIIPTLKARREQDFENILIDDDDVALLSVIAFMENEYTGLF